MKKAPLTSKFIVYSNVKHKNTNFSNDIKQPNSIYPSESEIFTHDYIQKVFSVVIAAIC